VPDDIVALERAFEANEHDAQALVSGLSEGRGTWQPEPGS
jgi:hypothetical protein